MNALFAQKLCDLRKVPYACRDLPGRPPQLFGVLQQEVAPVVKGHLAAVQGLLHQLICQLDFLLVLLTQPWESMGKILITQRSGSSMLPVLAARPTVCVARRRHKEEVDQALLQLL